MPAKLAPPQVRSPAILLPHLRKLTTTPTTSQPAVPADPGRPHSPSVPLAPSPPTEKARSTLTDRLAQRFRELLPNTTETYVAYDVTRTLYLECALQAAYADGEEYSPSAAFWYSTCARPPTFQSWSQVTVLHMWMLAARMRALDRERVKIWQQHFIDHFFYDAEEKMTKRYGIKSAGKRGGYMKDLFHQYRGTTAAFDEGLIRGDAVLATAIWRNVFNASEDVDLEVLAMVTSHVRRVVSKLGCVDDEIVLSGRIKFGLPEEERTIVRQKSALVDKLVDPAGHQLKPSASMAS